MDSLNKHKLELLSEATFEGICIHEQGILLDANQQFANIFGYTLDELKGMNGFDLIHPQSQEAVRGYIASGFEEPYEAVCLKKDGSEIIVEVRARDLQRDEKILRLAFYRDITERKAMEKKLAESEKRYRELYENSPIALYRTRISDGKILECNRALVELFGYDNKQDLLATNSVLAQYVNQQDRKKLLSKLKEKKRLEGFQIQLKRKNGEVLWVEDTVEIFPEQNRLEGAMQDITASKLLTKAEKKVFRLLVEGKANKQIAKHLGNSIRTIEDHRSHIMQKLNVDNLPDLVRKAQSLRPE